MRCLLLLELAEQLPHFCLVLLQAVNLLLQGAAAALKLCVSKCSAAQHMSSDVYMINSAVQHSK
jgi:hypothetical protein